MLLLMAIAYLSATSNVDLNLIVSHVDTMTVSLGNINVQTTSPGYKLYIGMTGSTTSLNSTSNTIPATTGSLIAPVSLTRGSWGYAIPSNTTHLVSSGFNSEYTTISSNVPDTSKRFAVPPASSSNPQLLAVSTSATSAAGDDYPIYYGVRANSDTPAGTYTNNVMFTAVADAAATETMTLTPSSVEINTANNIVVKTSLYATTASTNANITFTPQGGTASALSCTKTSSTPVTYNCTIPANLVSTVGTYAITATFPTYDKTYNTNLTVVSTPLMQDFTAAQCNAMTTNQSTRLKDSRDNNIYTITKLADGNCWMTENLRLGNSTATITLTSNDSDVTSDFVLPVAQTSGSEAWSDATNSTNSKHVYATGNATYGNYYNWYTATAGTGTGTMTSTSATDLLNATSSVCPKGWRLPDGGQSTKMSFYQLDKAYGGSGGNRTDTTQRDKFMASPLDFPYSGYALYVGGAGAQGIYGRWWSRSATAITGYVYDFTITSDGIFEPQNYVYAGYGFSVRCLADTRTLFGIDKMQEMTPQIVKNTTTPLASATQADTDGSHKGDNSYVPQRTLTDIRDSKTYQVRKLADGNIWMTQNLALVGPFYPDQSDSDVTWNKVTSGANQTFMLTASDDGTWCLDDSSTCINKSTVLQSSNNNYGAYYNWFAATAGTGTHALTANNIASSSICSKGWILPTSSDFNLYIANITHGLP